MSLKHYTVFVKLRTFLAGEIFNFQNRAEMRDSSV